MWHGEIRNKEYITRLITCQPQNVQGFLMNHMQLNLRQLARILGKNEEYAQLFLHKVLLQMSRANDQPRNNDWKDKPTIMAWESVISLVVIFYSDGHSNFQLASYQFQAFVKNIVAPIEKDIEKSMDQLQKLFKEDLDGAKSSTLIVLEELGTETIFSSPWQPQIWHPRQVVLNFQNLERFLGMYFVH